MFNSNRAFTPSHRAQLDAIRSASNYAHFAQNELVYVNKSVGTWFNSYNWAIADYFGKPEVVEIDISHWTGEVGQPICIKAKDNILVFRVNLWIWNTADSNALFEAGEAEQSKEDRSLWIYTTSSNVPHGPGVRVDVVAYDLPGNSGAGFLELE